MKISFKILASFLLLCLAVACVKKNVFENVVGNKGTTLTANSSSVVLTSVTPSASAITLNWTDPVLAGSDNNHMFTIQVDLPGGTFMTPIFSTAVYGTLSTTLSNSQLESIFTNNYYPLNASKSFSVRVIASYINGTDPVASAPINVSITPYKMPFAVALPASNTLFLVGGASPGGWNNPVPVPSQQFTLDAESGIFTISSLALTSGSVLFLPVNGDWSDKYGFDGNNNTNNTTLDKLKRGGGDVATPSVSGNYKIEVNFQYGIFRFFKL